MWLPPDFRTLAVATTSSLTLRRVATAAQLAASFNLSSVWSSTQPTRALLPALSNSTATAALLYKSWSLESPLRAAGSTPLSFVADPFSATVSRPFFQREQAPDAGYHRKISWRWQWRTTRARRAVSGSCSALRGASRADRHRRNSQGHNSGRYRGEMSLPMVSVAVLNPERPF